MAPDDIGRAKEARNGLYERDFYSWAKEQAALIRAGRLDALDAANLAEEVDDMGESVARALRSSYRVILLHLLKRQHQPEKRSRSWTNSIGRERDNAAFEIEKQPGLKPRRKELLREAYRLARREAARQTRLALATFPEECPYTPGQVEDEAFLP